MTLDDVASRLVSNGFAEVPVSRFSVADRSFVRYYNESAESDLASSRRIRLTVEISESLVGSIPVCAELELSAALPGADALWDRLRLYGISAVELVHNLDDYVGPLLQAHMALRLVHATRLEPS